MTTAKALELDGNRKTRSNRNMGKYDALGAFLRRWRVRNDAAGLELSFTHIERIIGGFLPQGAIDPAWWQGDGNTTAPHRRSWNDAGFEAVAECKTERVYFRKLSG